MGVCDSVNSEQLRLSRRILSLPCGPHLGNRSRAGEPDRLCDFFFWPPFGVWTGGRGGSAAPRTLGRTPLVPQCFLSARTGDLLQGIRRPSPAAGATMSL